MIKTPILVIIFNRPDFTKRLYDILRKMEPAKLYIISDGARTKEEDKDVQLSRSIFSNIDWDCDAKYDFADTNVGLRTRISGGINWAFQFEERLIILEDDCIPHSDFFIFCETMLEKYKSDQRVMTINGCNLNPSICESLTESYFFSKYANSWGWATWKRAWTMYDKGLQGLDDPFVLKNFTVNLPSRKRSLIYWKYKLNEVKSQKINSWAYRWMFSLWENSGLAIVPRTNLVRNIGNDKRSSNTKGKLHYINIETSTLHPDHIIHPKHVLSNFCYDEWVEDSIYSKSIRHRIIWLIKKLTFQI